MQQLGDESFLVAAGEADLRLDQEPACQLLDLAATLRLVETFEQGQVELTDQLAMELLLDDLIAVRLGFARADRQQWSGGRGGGAVSTAQAVAKVHRIYPLPNRRRRPERLAGTTSVGASMFSEGTSLRASVVMSRPARESEWVPQMGFPALIAMLTAA